MKLSGVSRLMIIVLLLYCPVFYFYWESIFSTLAGPGLVPTGFISYDMFYYMANAREYLDHPGFHLFYQNPFSDSYHGNYIYFQPHIFLLGMALKLFGNYPGTIFCVFGLISGLVCLWIVVKFIESRFGLDSPPKLIALTILCWGGGLLSLGGFIYLLFKGQSPGDAYQYAYIFDPFEGWWFLNLGRNLVYPVEAYYHAVFFGAIYAIYLQRYRLFLFLVLLLCLSHPFSGSELLAVGLTYFFIECFIIRNAMYPRWIFYGLVAIAVIHVGYYLVYLMQDPEHRQLVQRWRELHWVFEWPTPLLAYGLAGGLFVWNVRTRERLRGYFTDSFHRLLLAWFVVALLLANNDLFFNPPYQPLHFTRGYIYTPLLLMAYPVLLKIINFILREKEYRVTVMPILLLIALSDNLIWMPLTAFTNARNPFFFTDSNTNQVYAELSSQQYRDHLVITNDSRAAYWVTVYTPLQSWYSHEFNTPAYRKKENLLFRFFTQGVIPIQWMGRQIVILLNKKPGIDYKNLTLLKILRKSYENADYVVYTGKVPG